MKIQAIKPQLTSLSSFWTDEAPTLRIPTIQRQFVWDAEDVRDLIDSVVNGYLMLLDALLHRNGATNWAGKNVVSEECAVHHIFPREYLKDHEETRAECINCIGNLTLIDPGINSEIGDRPPEDYFQEYKDPEIFERHMIPSDPKLWKFENYERFLDARLKLMWTKAAEMLNELR